MNRIMAGLVVSFLLACRVGAASDDIVLESGETRTSVLELYTSEGCSSCPPADRFMSNLIGHPQLWIEWVPVAFHVDYWDYIGWRDRFANPAYSARQREYARLDALRTVYTPGFLLNGSEWRGRSVRDLSVERSPAGRLTAVVNEEAVIIGYDVAQPITDPMANIALLGFGLSSDVNAGENNGRTLLHDFVVLAMEQVPLDSVRGAWTASTGLPGSDHKAERVAVAVWVSAHGRPQPLQAVGGWLN